VSFFDRRLQRVATVSVRKYSPDQARDDHGMFTASGASGGFAGADKHPYVFHNGAEKEAFRTADRQTNLSPHDQGVQHQSIYHYVTNKQGLLDEYHSKFGTKIANADNAKQLFGKGGKFDSGYVGTNSAAVHEASSALNKDVWAANLKANPEPDALLYAGGSGSGKSSALKQLMPDAEKAAAAVLDGNLSKLSSAKANISKAVAAGKVPHVVYVYRDPTDAWVNGVVKRMNDNKSEGGRIVPMSTFLQNTSGSLEVARTLKAAGVKVTGVDNTGGKGKAFVMNDKQFAAVTVPATDKLRATLVAETKILLGQHKITESQYHALIK
jgi:hypothetical protein